MSRVEGELRVLLDGRASGAVNMATDEAILQAVNTGEAGATLRVYGWSEPTVSLGYFQAYADYEAQEGVRGLAVVRRQTGGGAILHDDEVTYSLVVPREEERWDIEGLYRLVHDAAAEVLAGRGAALAYRGGQDDGNSQRGPFFCFSRRHRLDMTIGGAKVLGSAQRRLRRAVLQHGSLILGDSVAGQGGTSLRATGVGTIETGQFGPALAKAVAARLGLEPRQGELGAPEQNRLGALEEKYKGPAWTRLR